MRPATINRSGESLSMDFLDLLWETGQNSRIAEVSERVEKLRQQQQLPDGDFRTVAELAAENMELKLRLGSLVRLLVNKQIITVEEYAAMIAESRAKV